MTLTERIISIDEARRLRDNVIPFDREQRRAKPRWMERMDEQGLPNKDYTRQGPDAA